MAYINWEKAVSTQKAVLLIRNPHPGAALAVETGTSVASRSAERLPLSLGDVRAAFSAKFSDGKMRQNRIADPDGYDLDSELPVALFSQQCRVSLRFTEKRMDTVVGAVYM